jgi:hypothetical protein
MIADRAADIERQKINFGFCATEQAGFGEAWSRTMPHSADTSSNEQIEARLRALKDLAVDAFSKDVLESAALVLADRTNPLRLNLFSTSMRMLLEHVMSALAPDDEVEACDWYKPEAGQTKPVRRQRIQYWLQGGLTDAYLTDELQLDPAPLRTRLMSAFNDLNKHVHGRSATFVQDVHAQDVEAEATIAAVEALFDAYHACRRALIDPLVQSLDDEAVDTLMSETIMSVDEIASHYSVDEVCCEHTEVVAIAANYVRYNASGTVSVTLQFGSNSDVEKGDGAELEQGFPFDCEFDVPIDDPRDLASATVTSGVDTSSWFEGRYDEDD